MGNVIPFPTSSSADGAKSRKNAGTRSNKSPAASRIIPVGRAVSLARMKNNRVARADARCERPCAAHASPGGCLQSSVNPVLAGALDDISAHAIMRLARAPQVVCLETGTAVLKEGPPMVHEGGHGTPRDGPCPVEKNSHALPRHFAQRP